MNKFKLYIEEHKESIIILITILQVISLVFFSGIKKQEHKNEVIVTKPMLISYSEIAKELNKIKDIEVMEIENCGESWSIKIKLNGKNISNFIYRRYCIIKSIEELKNFTVKTYNINGKDNNLLTILELNR